MKDSGADTVIICDDFLGIKAESMSIVFLIFCTSRNLDGTDYQLC